MAAPLNECQFKSAGAGTADFVVDQPVTGFFTPAQCTNPIVVDGATYTWRAESNSLQDHELFQGTYTAATQTIARTTILQSSNAGAKVNFNTPPRVRLVLPSQGVRSILTADTTYYIRTTGNDTTGNGTSTRPWLTLQHAMNVLSATVDGGGYIATFNIGAGTFSGMGFIDVPGLKILSLTGAGRTLTTITQGTGLPIDINNGESLSGYNSLTYGVYIITLTLAPTVSTVVGRACLAASVGQTMGLDDVGFIIPDGFAAEHVETSGGIFHGTSIHVSTLGTAATAMFEADNLGYIEVSGSVVLTGSPTFTIATINCTRNSLVELEASCTFTGTTAAAVTRFYVNGNSTIYTFDQGISYIPGTSGGVIDSGGVYA